MLAAIGLPLARSANGRRDLLCQQIERFETVHALAEIKEILHLDAYGVARRELDVSSRLDGGLF